MISDEYKSLNEAMHKESLFDGPDALRYLQPIQHFIDRMDVCDAIDFGCGCALLSQQMGVPCQNYDPCIPQYSTKPRPADLLVSLDVLEHVEPEFLEETLDYMRELAPKAFLVICIAPDKTKLLPDGTNPHRSLLSPKEWHDKLRARYNSVRTVRNLRAAEVAFECW